MGTYHGHAGERLTEIYNQLYTELGSSNWWPAGSELEVVVGAILTQNTAWSNVEKALGNLERHELLPRRVEGTQDYSICPEEVGHKLLDLSDEDLAELIRPAGFYRVKARRLKAVLKFFDEICSFDLPWLSRTRRYDTEMLRRSLLALTGVGPETSDSILLYALNRPTFVVDAYTIRLFGRHNLLPPVENENTRPREARYESIRRMFMEALQGNAAMYNEYHALIVRACKLWCRKSSPRCPTCPLGRSLWCWQKGSNPASFSTPAEGDAAQV